MLSAFSKKKSRESSRERAKSAEAEENPELDRVGVGAGASAPIASEYEISSAEHPLNTVPKLPEITLMTKRPLPDPPKRMYPELREISKMELEDQDYYFQSEERDSMMNPKKLNKKKSKKLSSYSPNESSAEDDSSSEDSSSSSSEYEKFWGSLSNQVRHPLRFFINNMISDSGGYSYMLVDGSTIVADEMDKDNMDREVERLHYDGYEKNKSPFVKSENLLKKLRRKWKNQQKMNKQKEEWRKARRDRKARFPSADRHKELAGEWQSKGDSRSKPRSSEHQHRNSTESKLSMMEKRHQQETSELRRETSELKQMLNTMVDEFKEKRKPERLRNPRTEDPGRRTLSLHPKKVRAKTQKGALSEEETESRLKEDDDDSSGDHSREKQRQKREFIFNTAITDDDSDEEFDSKFWRTIKKSCEPTNKIEFANSFMVLKNNNIVRMFDRIKSNYEGNGSIINRMEEAARAFCEVGISKKCFVRFFAENLLTRGEKDRVSVAIKNISSIRELTEALKTHILSGDGSVREEQNANRWIREAFSKETDISKISTECYIMAKKIIASQADYSSVSTEIIKDRVESKARQLLLNGISNFTKDDSLDRIVESGAFNEPTLYGLTKKVLPFFQPKIRKTARNNHLQSESEPPEGTSEVAVHQLQQSMESFMTRIEGEVSKVKEKINNQQKNALDSDHENPDEMQNLLQMINNVMGRGARRNFPPTITASTICYECNEVGSHTAYDCTTRPKTAAGILVCYQCGEEGHTRQSCPKRKQNFGRTACNICKPRGLSADECRQLPPHCFYHAGQSYPNCPLCASQRAAKN